MSYGALLTNVSDAGRVVLSPLSPSPSSFASVYNGALYALVTSTSATATFDFEMNLGGSFTVPSAAARNAFDTGWFPMRSQGSPSFVAGAHNLLLEPEFLHVVAVVRAVDTTLAGFVFPGMGSGECGLQPLGVGVTVCGLGGGWRHWAGDGVWGFQMCACVVHMFVHVTTLRT